MNRLQVVAVVVLAVNSIFLILMQWWMGTEIQRLQKRLERLREKLNEEA